MMRKIFVGKVKDIKFEDGRQSAQFEIEGHADSCMFVRVFSWDEKKDHAEIAKFIGKEVVILVDIIGE